MKPRGIEDKSEVNGDSVTIESDLPAKSRAIKYQKQEHKEFEKKRQKRTKNKLKKKKKNSGERFKRRRWPNGRIVKTVSSLCFGVSWKSLFLLLLSTSLHHIIFWSKKPKKEAQQERAIRGIRVPEQEQRFLKTLVFFVSQVGFSFHCPFIHCNANACSCMQKVKLSIKLFIPCFVGGAIMGFQIRC